MRSLAKLILAILINAVALIAAAYLIPDVSFTTDLEEIGIIALVLTGLNFFVRPILKLFLGPLVVLTLGFGLIIVNAIIIYVLDFFFDALTIQTTIALLETTILVGVLNFVFHFATKK